MLMIAAKRLFGIKQFHQNLEDKAKNTCLLDKLFNHLNVCTNPATDTEHPTVSVFNRRSKLIEKPVLGRVGLAGQNLYLIKLAACASQLQNVSITQCCRPAKKTT